MTRVRKRDGSFIDYDEGKVAHEILMAVEAAGEGDSALAAEMAEVVTFFLDKYHGGPRGETVVAPDQIADMIERVLLETAPPAVAKAFILRRQRQRELAQTITVHRPPSYGQKRLFPEDTLTVEADSTAEAHHWDRMRIVKALIRESDVAPPLANEIAARVEERLFNSGLRRVTTGLIRELIDVELFDAGLNQHRDRQAIVGIPKFDLEEAVLRGRREGHHFRDPADLDRFVCESVLQRYTLQEVHSPEVAGAHVDGKLHLHGLGSPLRFFSLRICPEGIKFGWPPIPTAPAASATATEMGDRIGPPKTEDQFFALLRRFAEESLELVTDTVTFTNVTLVLAPLAARKDAEGRRNLMRRAIGTLSGRIAHRLRLEFPIDVPATLRQIPAVGLGGNAEQRLTMGELAGIVRELARDAITMQLEGSHQALLAPDLIVAVDGETLTDPMAHGVLELAADCASRHGGPRFRFHRPARRPSSGSGSGEWRGLFVRDALAGDAEPAAVAVSVNLPQAAYRAGRGNHDAFSAECERLLLLARKAVSERFHFLLGSLSRFANPLLAIGRESGLSAHPASFDLRNAHARLELVGLAEAMAYLSGDRKRGTQVPLFRELAPPDDPASSETAMRGGLRALSYLAFALKEQATQTPVDLRLAEGRNLEVAHRFRRIDARTFPAHVGQLVDRTMLPTDGPYSQGIALPGPSDPMACLSRESRFHTMLEAGAEIIVPPVVPTHSPGTLVETIKQAVWRSGVHGIAFPVFAVSCPACGDCRTTPLAIPACCPTCGYPTPDYGWLIGNQFTRHPIPEIAPA